jgi:hypothetical protein
MAQTVQELRIRWDAYIGVPVPQVTPGTVLPSNIFTLVERRPIPGRIPRQRNPQLSSDQIVALALDNQSDIVDWQLVPDPRIIRAELPGPSGELSGQILHRAEAELLLILPETPSIEEIVLYEPRWTGTNFIFEYLGAVSLR